MYNETPKTKFAALGSSQGLSVPTMSEKLEMEKNRLESRLKEVNEAIEALNASPEVKNAVNAVAKLGHI